MPFEMPQRPEFFSGGGGLFDADLFPGMPQKWGLSFDINTQPGPNGRSAGSYAWDGLLNCCYWVDPVKKVTGALWTSRR